MGKQKLPLTLLVFLLTGCGASLSDLQDMSADGRADYVCERRPEVSRCTARSTSPPAPSRESRRR